MLVKKSKTGPAQVKLAYERSDDEPMSQAEAQEIAAWHDAGYRDGSIVDVTPRRIFYQGKWRKL
jgi:hypothetical protein